MAGNTSLHHSSFLYRPWIIRAVVALLVASLVVFVDGSASAESPNAASNGQAGQRPTDDFADRDGDKVFESLERELEERGSEERVEVIIHTDRRPSDNVIRAHQRSVGNFEAGDPYRYINAYAARLTPKQVERLTPRPDVTRIQDNAEMHTTLATATSEFGTNSANADFSGGTGGNLDSNTAYSKEDVVIAVIDTGIDADHPDLDGDKVIAFADFIDNDGSACSDAPDVFTAPYAGSNTPYDDNGHGTHVASIAAGDGDGGNTGVAPGAALIGVRALMDSEGPPGGSAGGSSCDVDAAIQWVIDNRIDFGIDVLNLSLGGGGNGDGSDSTSMLVDQAVDAGIVVAISAGNSGPDAGSVASPAVSKKGLTVGAMADPLDVDGPDIQRGFRLAGFSSRGPTTDNRIKPDVVAAGSNIKAAALGSGSNVFSGTSMAAPFVAGTAALMIDAADDDGETLTPTQIKNGIKNTAVDWGAAGDDNDSGAGRLDGYAAVEAVGTPGVLPLGAPPVPTHTTGSECLTGSGDRDDWSLSVPNTDWPIAVTLLFSGTGNSPDLDLELQKPGGGAVPISPSDPAVRQESFAYTPSSGETDAYTLTVKSVSGSGSYRIDVSGATSITSPSDGCPAPTTTTTTTTKPKSTTTTTTTTAPPKPKPKPAPDPVGSGYSLIDDDGGLFNFGDAKFFGSVPGLRLKNPGLAVGDIVGGFPTHSGSGYVIFDDDGRVFTFGKAKNLGSVFDRVRRGIVGRSEITGGFPVNDGAGYILIDLDGGVHTFGKAKFLGSVPGLRQTNNIGQARVIDGFSTHGGAGYVLVDDKGGLFNFGKARFLGSVPGLRLKNPSIGEAKVVGGFATHGGKGYVVIDDQGGLFNFGTSKFLGSVPQLRQTNNIGRATIVGGFATHGGDGYVVIDDQGGLFNFGKAEFLGSVPGERLKNPSIGKATVVGGFAV